MNEMIRAYKEAEERMIYDALTFGRGAMFIERPSRRGKSVSQRSLADIRKLYEYQNPTFCGVDLASPLNPNQIPEGIKRLWKDVTK